MSFNYMNANNVQGCLVGFEQASGNSVFSKPYPLFDVSQPVDVSGMEMAFVNTRDGSTVGTQTMVTGASTVILKPYDGNTTAGAASGNNALFAATDYTNAPTGAGSFTVVHGAVKATGTSTTDLDADDWVNLDVTNITGAGGFGTLGFSAFFVHGIPGSVA